MFRDIEDRHGSRDLGLVRRFCAKVQPLEIPVLHVSPRFWQRPTRRFPTFFPASTHRQRRCRYIVGTSPVYSGLAGFSVSEHLQTSRNASSRNSNVSVLGQRHTALTFGRDSAAKSSTMHPDWLLISCPCRLSPIRSHETLRAGGRSEGRGGDAPRVARLGGRVSENVMFCGFVLSCHLSCFVFFYP